MLMDFFTSLPFETLRWSVNLVASVCLIAGGWLGFKSIDPLLSSKQQWWCVWGAIVAFLGFFFVTSLLIP